jgi:hypothetical protein
MTRAERPRRRGGANLAPRIAALAGQWDDVVRLTAPAVPLHQSDEFHMTVALATALVALGRLDDAVAALGRLQFDSDETRVYRPPIDALIALARGEPNLAVAAVSNIPRS